MDQMDDVVKPASEGAINFRKNQDSAFDLSLQEGAFRDDITRASTPVDNIIVLQEDDKPGKLTFSLASN